MSEAIKAIKTARQVADSTSLELTLEQALGHLDDGDPWNPEFWQGVRFATSVLKALAGEDT